MTRMTRKTGFRELTRSRLCEVRAPNKTTRWMAGRAQRAVEVESSLYRCYHRTGGAVFVGVARMHGG